MARTTAENVIRMDASGDTVSSEEKLTIVGIKVTANAAADVFLRSGDDVSDPILWESTFAAAGEVFNQVLIRAKEGIYMESNLGSPIVYLYLK